MNYQSSQWQSSYSSSTGQSSYYPWQRDGQRPPGWDHRGGGSSQGWNRRRRCPDRCRNCPPQCCGRRHW